MLLCREQNTNGKRTVHVVTACGIFVQHILDAAPIDKYFEMFKPGSGSEGGFVRLKMRLLSGPDAKKSKGTIQYGLLQYSSGSTMCCFVALVYLSDLCRSQCLLCNNLSRLCQDFLFQ